MIIYIFLKLKQFSPKINNHFKQMNNITNLELYNLNKDNYTKLSELFCSNHGNFFNDTFSCDCDIAFFTANCSVKGMDAWGKGWTAIQVMFSIIFTLYSLINTGYFIKNIRSVNTILLI